MVLTAAETYEADLPSSTCLGSQLVSWRVRWAEVTDVDKPSSALEALNRRNPETHSNIQALLKLLFTLSLTSCDAERTFSALKRAKTVGRFTMGGRAASRLSSWKSTRGYMSTLQRSSKCTSRRETPAPAET